ncbi:zinc finger protein 13-like isoform X2 [Argiope bruennichi]|uniref:Zinc finger protein 205 like protein n=1 Tax=Argiope bruennichi TaxID=94029 RepID=A0A8T0FKA5_ARGBR|nr:zinc finger protein 13-like isoform X2 [Argiope bruennichi]KAF8789273.1 Zinc finger protein 205 like protein [Argiope bruennichi]
MFEIYSEVRAIISSNVVSAIEGCVFDAIKERIFTAKVEEVTAEDEIQYHLSGTLDGILIAKNKLEELLNSIHIKRLAKETNELDNTTLSEENSSLADEGNTSYDKEGTDKTSCLSDDKEHETNASSNGYVSTNTESSVKTLRMKPLSKKLRFFLKERPRSSQRTRARLALQLRTLKKKSILRNKPQRVSRVLRNDPDRLIENLQQMKLATEDSDVDSGGTDGKSKTHVRLPCKARNHDSVSGYKHFCELCSFKTKRSSHFLKHMTVHEKVLSCPHCSYQTTKQHYYDRHQRLHCSKRGFIHQCEQCCYKTHRREHYVRHVTSVHGEQRPYLCHVCGKAFKRGDALQQHHQTHSEVQSENANYKCSICEKQFRSQSHLFEHKAVHSEYRSFLCEICGASFKTRSVHRKHVQSIHRNPRSFSCDVCCKKFSTQYTLKRHKKIHTVKSGIIPKSLLNSSTTTEIDTSLKNFFPETVTIPSISAPLTVDSHASVLPPTVCPVSLPTTGCAASLPTPTISVGTSEVLPMVTPPVIQPTEPTTILYLTNTLQQL